MLVMLTDRSPKLIRSNASRRRAGCRGELCPPHDIVYDIWRVRPQPFADRHGRYSAPLPLQFRSTLAQYCAARADHSLPYGTRVSFVNPALLRRHVCHRIVSEDDFRRVRSELVAMDH